MKYKTRYLLFFTAMTLFHLAASFAHPVTPTIILELGLPDYMFGLMLATMMAANFLFSPFWGKINRSLSSRRSLLICCFGYGVAQLGFAWATGQAVILCFRFLAGIFTGGIFVSMLTYVINTARPEDQGKYLTYSATIHSVFGAFGYLIGGLVGEYSVRGTFLLQTATLWAAGALFRFCCQDDADAGEIPPAGELIRQANPLKAFADGRYFMNKDFALLFLTNIFMNLGNTGFDQAFNYYLKAQLGLTSAYNGIIKAIVGLIAFVFNMSLCLWIIRKTDTKRSFVVLATLCALAALGTIFVPGIVPFILFGIVLYAGYSVSLPVLQDMVATQAEPAQKNLVMGFYNATKSLGSVIGSLLAGFLYALGAKVPFCLVAGTYLLAVVTAAAYNVGRRKKS